VVADESVRTLADVERLAAAGVRAVNLKLMKVGGLTPALQMLRRARSLGLGIMLGCMVETSLGVTAMAHLAGLADWLDLDAPLLVTNDPFAGIRYDEQMRIHLPSRPGIGVQRKKDDDRGD
jgi:L-alanine-DL-glutamate epimerase-like enolase superfamily enzyme